MDASTEQQAIPLGYCALLALDSCIRCLRISRCLLSVRK